MVQAVNCEPFSANSFPALRENTGTFRKSSVVSTLLIPRSCVNSACYLLNSLRKAQGNPQVRSSDCAPTISEKQLARRNYTDAHVAVRDRCVLDIERLLKS